MTNIRVLTQEQNDRVQAALTKAEAAQHDSDKDAVEAIAATTAPAPANVVPNKAAPKPAPKATKPAPKPKPVGEDFVDSIKIITMPLPAIQKDPAPAIIDVEIVEPQPLSKAKAEALDKKLIAAVTTVGNSMGALADLVTEAKDGQIHLALGFASWTSYFAERVTTPMMAIGERKAVAAMLHDEGMSNRAIGAVLGVSVGTVVTDVRSGKAKAQEEAEATGQPVPTPKPAGKTVGKDGKEYKRPVAKKPAPQPQPQPKAKGDLEIRLDIVMADAENILEDIETLAANLETLYSTEGYKAGSDKEMQTILAKARKALAANTLPKPKKA